MGVVKDLLQGWKKEKGNLLKAWRNEYKQLARRKLNGHTFRNGGRLWIERYEVLRGYIKEEINELRNFENLYPATLIEDLEYIAQVYDIKNQMVFSHALIAYDELRKFHNSGIPLKRYDEIEQKIDKYTQEIEKYGGQVSIRLPCKPNDTLAILQSDIEDDVDTEALKAIIEVISGRKRLPKGQEERLFTKQMINDIIESMQKNIRRNNDGTITFKKFDVDSKDI